MSLVGTRLAGNRYHLHTLLGQGEMGEVYGATDTMAKREVAIKVLDAEAAQDGARVERFEREHRVGRELSHRNLPEVYELGPTVDGGWFLVMELLKGETLEDRLGEDKALPAEEVAAIAAQVATALWVAHAQGCIHRDVAPKNIMIVPEKSGERVLLMDWGAVRFADQEPEPAVPDQPDDELDLDDHKELTAIGVRLGTPTYMSPEYIELGYVEPRSDLYSLGATMFRALTGEVPYHGSVLKVMEAHIEHDVPVPSARVEEVPPWMDDIVVQLMAKRPEGRIQDAQTLIERLESAVGRPLMWQDPVEAPLPATPTRRRGLEPLVLVAGCLSLVFACLFFIFLVALVLRFA